MARCDGDLSAVGFQKPPLRHAGNRLLGSTPHRRRRPG
jgi:hypothetical protein